MTEEKEFTRAVESLASTYGEAARLLVVAERERVLGIIEDAMRGIHHSQADTIVRQTVYLAMARIRDGEHR